MHNRRNRRVALRLVRRFRKAQHYHKGKRRAWRSSIAPSRTLGSTFYLGIAKVQRRRVSKGSKDGKPAVSVLR